MNYILGLMMVQLAVESQSIDLPWKFDACPRNFENFTECVEEAASIAVRSMSRGLRDFGIPPLEPFETNGVSSTYHGQVISMKQEYKNIRIYGLTEGLKFQCRNIDIDAHTLHCDSYNDRINFLADYAMNGNIAIFPFFGAGTANITMLDVKSKNVIGFEKYEKNDRQFVRINELDMKLSPRKINLESFDIAGTADFSDEEVKHFFDENSEMLFTETKQPFEEKFSTIFKGIMNRVFNRIPMNKLFPD